MQPHMDTQFDAVIPTPFGAIGIGVQDDFLVTLQLMPSPHTERSSSDPFVQQVVSQLKQYLHHPHTPLDIPIAIRGTPFQKRVWKAISAIPAGETLTYSELAEKVSSGPRAVANVCGANHVPLVIPCHRVVAKYGLGGFMQGEKDGLAVKRWLLDHEAKA
jgi:methylated-DNA-[protein]-cysteine S-methyltransferase